MGEGCTTRPRFTLIASKDCVSKFSHILRSWASGLQGKNLGRTRFSLREE